MRGWTQLRRTFVAYYFDNLLENKQVKRDKIVLHRKINIAFNNFMVSNIETKSVWNRNSIDR